jgi:hypothetical protein
VHRVDVPAGQLLNLADRTPVCDREAVQDAPGEGRRSGRNRLPGGAAGFGDPRRHVPRRQEDRVVQVDDGGEGRLGGGVSQ